MSIGSYGECMKILVLGATGVMGREVAAKLEAAGADVVRAHRGTGVDAYTGAGLDAAMAGVDVVVEAVNSISTRAKVSIDFFGTVAENVSAAAKAAGVKRVVCLSIVNAAVPQLNSKMGYYQGKARQEEIYRDRLGDSVTLVRTTQWFELAATLMDSLSFGPIGAIAHMRTRPLAAVDGAAVLAQVALDGAGPVVEVAGPQEMDLADVARAVAKRRGRPRWVIAVNFGGKAMRDGGLSPSGEYLTTETTFTEWLDGVAK